MLMPKVCFYTTTTVGFARNDHLMPNAKKTHTQRCVFLHSHFQLVYTLSRVIMPFYATDVNCLVEEKELMTTNSIHETARL